MTLSWSKHETGKLTASDELAVSVVRGDTPQIGLALLQA
jgi:hypothetical protein